MDINSYFLISGLIVFFVAFFIYERYANKKLQEPTKEVNDGKTIFEKGILYSVHRTTAEELGFFNQEIPGLQYFKVKDNPNKAISKNEMVELIKNPFFTDRVDGETLDDCVEKVSRKYSEINDSVFVSEGHITNEPNAFIKYLKKDIVLFEPQTNNKVSWFNSTCSSHYANQPPFQVEKYAYVIGVGGVYLVTVSQNRIPTVVLYNDKLPIVVLTKLEDIESTAKLVLAVPSMTREVIEEMKAFDMTNNPPVGRVFLSNGYLVVKLRFDNHHFLFYDLKTYLEIDKENSTIVDDADIEGLIKMRYQRSTDLHATSFGFEVNNPTKQDIRWFV